MKDKRKEIEILIEVPNKGTLLEGAGLGDKVTYKKQKGYIIGQSSNGDFIVQIQGNTAWAKPSEVKVLGAKAESSVKPMHNFDEITQKVLFEQFVKCGIYVGNTAVKTNNCYIKYSNYTNAKLDENVNVYSDGDLNQMPKENVKIYEDPNDFANPEDYVDGVIINTISGEAIDSVQINAIDYTGAIGDADPVRVIQGIEGNQPQMDTLPKSVLRTLSV